MADGTDDLAAQEIDRQTPEEPFVPTPEGYEEIEVEAQRAEVRTMNQRRVQLLESAGVNVAPAVLGARLETVVVHLVGDEGTERDNLDAAFEERLAPLLDQIASQVKQAMLQRDAAEGSRLLGSDGRSPLRSV